MNDQIVKILEKVDAYDNRTAGMLRMHIKRCLRQDISYANNSFFRGVVFGIVLTLKNAGVITIDDADAVTEFVDNANVEV